MKNPSIHIKLSRQVIFSTIFYLNNIYLIHIIWVKAKKELDSGSISQKSYENIIRVYNEKLNQEMNRSLSLEQEKIHWENEYKLISKNNKNVCIFIK